MSKKLVYDIPLRLFHWFFAFLFLTAFIIAKTVDSESPVYSFHMLAGITLNFVIFLRILWGLFGTRHSRFTGFKLNPKELLQYFLGLFSKSKRFWAGHNPASSWAGLTMIALGLGLGITGFLMTTGPNKEDFEDFHEIFANSFIVVVIFHIFGIILHTIRHKDLIGLSMINGRKEHVSEQEVISQSRPFIGVVFVLLVISFNYFLQKNYDPQNRILKIFSAELHLGDSEGEVSSEAE